MKIFPPALSLPAVVLLAALPTFPVRSGPPAAFAEGEWSPAGRITDYSFAGYGFGEAPLPTARPVTNVKKFGAVGDGVADDTKAFQAAITATSRGVIFIPAGRYRITGQLVIGKSDLVLRGAGPDRTTLLFPVSLTEALGAAPSRTKTGESTSRYSFGRGFLEIRGIFRRERLATLTADARRGDQALALSSAAGLRVGQMVEIFQRDEPGQSLAKYLYNDQSGNISKLGTTTTEQTVRITALHGNRMKIDRPLRTDLRAAWQPEVVTFDPTVTGSGIEDLACVFPELPYPGHFNEKGFNGIELLDVAHCWVRNVRIVNADGALFLQGRFCTAEDIVITAGSDRGRTGGHHAIQTSNADDNLIRRFDIRIPFVHDLSIERAAGNVYESGHGADLCFDGHKEASFANLFTDIDTGAGTRPWAHGGGPDLGLAVASWNTWWNIASRRPLPAPDASYGPSTITLIDVKGIPARKPAAGLPANRPKNLREAQLAWRRSGSSSR